jgi:Tfp pilus assembly protein PilF
MSLLLDALKKAEKAKDDAKRRAQLESGADPGDPSQQVRTRNELPDISKPLEINSSDFDAPQASPARSAVPDAFSTAPATRARPEPPRAPTRDAGAEPPPKPRQSPASESAPDMQAAQKVAAKKVFEAKFREPNPKLPFYITMTLLGLFSLGTVVYFWYQLRPPPPLVNSNPKPPTEERKVEAPPQATAQSMPAGASPAGAIPGLPQAQPPIQQPAATAPRTATAPTIPQVPASATPKPPPSAQAAPAVTTARPSAESPRPNARQETAPSRQVTAPSVPQRAPADPSKLSISRPLPSVDPRVDAGWQAYNQGDMNAARSSYQAMLRADPMNRDALLGMAAVEIRSNRNDQAVGYYQSLLQANPRDTHAQAGLLALRGQLGDAVQTESRVKNLLASDPDAQALYFTLGNQYAQQARWPEAQQAYFKAYTAEPENPDFAYNLAVSLDQLRQPKLALEYYRRALSLSQQRASSFDQALARNRVQELAK